MCIIKIKSIPIKFMLILLTGLLGWVNKANAQLTQFNSMYFQNQYLGNPAMAAKDPETILIANMGYQRQFNSIPGSPVLSYGTVEYNLGDRTGLGLNINNDKAGLISRTRIMGTYSYHLPLNFENHLDFGVSIGGKFASLDNNNIIGDQDDNLVQNFKEENILDGDVGISYTRKSLTLQMSFSNLNNHFQKDKDNKQYVDYSTFYSAVSYKFFSPGTRTDLNFEPIVAYRGIKGNNSIIDAGLRFNIPEYNNMNFSGFYHSNKAVSAGFGMMMFGNFGFFASYSKFIGNTVYKNNVIEFGLYYSFKNNNTPEHSIFL